VGHPSLRTLEATNRFADRVHRAMSPGVDRSARRVDYFVSRTTLRASEYGASVRPLLAELGFSEEDAARAGGLTVLRCTVGDPHLAARRGRVDFIQGFARTLGETLAAQLREGA
jgi:hypothetical protein